MKPRSKRQVLVCELSGRLPDLAESLGPWAFKNCIDHVGYRTKVWTHCLSCGAVWPTTSMEIKTEVCDGCGWKLKLETTRKQKSRQWARFAVLDVSGDFQVIRYFDINCHMKSARKPSYYTREIMQHWLSPDGEYEIISTQVGGLGLSYDHFCGGPMTLKNKRDLWKYNVSVYKIHPKMKLLPVYRRNGFTSRVPVVRPFELLRRLATDSITETLLKTKQFGLLGYHLGDRSHTGRYWPSIKICIRNNYLVKDADIWLDYLNLLQYFRKDLHNPKYVCPRNLKKEHDRLVKRKDEITKRQDLELRMKKAAEDQLQYAKAKAIFFGIAFTDQDLEIKVLEHIEEFIKESEAHHHCVYSNRYFDKEDSLILSARINGKPIETIEISLSELRVKQSRGLQNQATEYHDRILSVVNKNMSVIRKRVASLNQEVAA